MHPSIRTSMSLLGCLMLVGLGLTSCGGSATPTTSATAGNMTLKVGQITPSMPFFPLYVAQQEGFFAKQGLTLNPTTPTSMGSGSKLATAVEANALEVGVGSITDAFTISRIDTHVKVVGAVGNDVLLDIVVGSKFEAQAHLTATSSLADKVKALVGKKIGISAPGSATDALITYLFRQQGLNAATDAIKEPLGAATATDLLALQSGRVDAVVVGNPGGQIAEVKGFGNILISPARGDVTTMENQLFGVIYTKQQIIDTKPKAIQAFIRAMGQADTFILADQNRTLGLLEKFLKIDAHTASLAWAEAKVSIPLSPQVGQANFNTANDFHVKAGLLAIALPYNDVVSTATINQALSGS